MRSSLLEMGMRRINIQVIIGAAFTVLSILLLGGCENDNIGYITQVVVSPSGEYQAEAVQVSYGATGGRSGVFLETGSDGAFPAEKEQNSEDSIEITETRSGWNADYDIQWTSDNQFTVIVSGRKWCNYYFVTIEGNEYTLIEGLTIDKDKTVYHEMMTDGDTVEITATVYVRNNLDDPVRFVVTGYISTYGPKRSVFDMRSASIQTETDLETGAPLVIGPGEDGSFEIKLTGTKKAEEEFDSNLPVYLFVHISDVVTDDEMTSETS